MDRLLLVNAVMGQFLTGFASRIFIVSLPTIALALDADILGISWALIAYQAFVAAINTTCLACAALVAVAFAASLTRGRARIEAAPGLGS